MKEYWWRFLRMFLVFIGIPFILGLVFWLGMMFILWELYIPDIDWRAVRIDILIAFVACLFLAVDE